MLIKMDPNNALNSKYKCDICKVNLNVKDYFKISVIDKRINKSYKLYDLCPKCFEKINKKSKIKEIEI